MDASKIIIDGRMINESGIGRYIRNLIANLKILDKKNNYYILHLKNDYDTLVYHNNFHKVLADFRWYEVSEQINLPRLLKSLKPDLVHFPHFNVPIFYDGKFVVTIHDLIHQHFSMERATTHGLAIYKMKQVGYRVVFKSALKKSSIILTPSYSVKRQLMGNWNIDGKKIKVTYEAVDNNIVAAAELMKQVGVDRAKEKFGIKKPYLFYVGNAHPHKNVEGLIRVFGQLRIKYPDLSLVLSGNDHYFWQRIRKEFQHTGVVYTGYVSDEEMVVFYKNAECFVLPSFEEGFGIPILEAMVCSCPVVSSSAGSLVEIGGDACLYFDPTSMDDMIRKISSVLDDKKLRQKLVEKGLKRYKEFSWKDLAKKTLEVYSSCV